MPRGPSNADKVRELLRLVGTAAKGPGRVYLVGGASAVLVGWRDTTVDVDLKLDPEPAGVFSVIGRAKEVLDMNIELAAPDEFIPALPTWRSRSVFIVRHGPVDFLHYDFHSQALAKIERGHAQDVRDVEAMHRLKLIDADQLMGFYETIEPRLARYPAIDPASFRRAVLAARQMMAAAQP